MKMHLIFFTPLFILSLRAESPQAPQVANLAFYPAERYSDRKRDLVLEEAPQELKDELKLLQDPKCLEAIKPKRLIFHGRSGMGKTTTAEVVAQILDKPAIIIPCGQLGNGNQNSVALDLRNIIRQTPRSTVMIFDDLARVLESSANNAADVPVQVWELLDQLRRTHLVIGILNQGGNFDPSVQTRLVGQTIEFKEPATASRKRILDFYVSENQYTTAPDTIETMVDKTNKFSIREIEFLVYTAMAAAKKRNAQELALQSADFETALERVSNSREFLANRETWIGLAKRKALENPLATLHIGATLLNHTSSLGSAFEALKNVKVTIGPHIPGSKHIVDFWLEKKLDYLIKLVKALLFPKIKFF